MRRTREAVRNWKPCSVCGHVTPYIHNGKRYCVNNDCQLVALRTPPEQTVDDQMAHALDVGCDYCGARAGLERYDQRRAHLAGFRCVDADACNARELAATKDDEDE